MKKTICCLLLLAVGIHIAAAQGSAKFKEFQEEQRRKQQQFHKEQQTKQKQQVQLKEEALQKQNEKYRQFIKERNEAFATYLKSRWKAFDSNKGLSRWEEPKPDVAPVCEKNAPNKEEAPRVIKTIDPIKTTIDPIVTPSKPKILIPPTPSPVVSSINTHTLKFFGSEVEVPWIPDLQYKLTQKPSEQSISHTWSTLSDAEYEDLLQFLVKTHSEFCLNDWGYYLLIEHISTMYCTDRNSQRLFQWFFLAQSSYDARVAFSGNMVTLLIPSQQRVNMLSYIVYNNVNYYLLDELQDLQTYDSSFAGANMIFNFNLEEYPKLEKNIGERSINFVYNEKQYNFLFEYNKNLVAYEGDYVFADFSVYFNAPISNELFQNMKRELQPIVSTMSKKQALEFLLKFVQYGFDYQTDGEQFGVENYLFSDESVFYPYGDCEDRSFFFTKLVQSLLDLPIVGLYYPGHIATAVAIEDNDVKGDFVQHNGKRFFVCDPTFIGAGIGRTQPQYEDTAAEVIAIKE